MSRKRSTASDHVRHVILKNSLHPETIRPEIVSALVDVFGDQTTKALVWLNSPNNLLDGEVPREHSRTVNGAHKVLGILWNMKDGFTY